MARPAQRTPPPPPARSGVSAIPRPPASSPPPPPGAVQREMDEIRDDMDAVLDAVGRRLDAADAVRVRLEGRVVELETRQLKDRERLVVLARHLREVLDEGKYRDRRLRQLESENERLRRGQGV
ncbi:MAG: hypothetical protein AB8I08_16735 [Sandaracinaceae bacterium]